MNSTRANQNLNAFAALRKLARPSEKNDSAEVCELCAATLFSQHRHLLEMPSRKIFCSCDPCALRFQDVVEGRFKLIPRDTISLPDFQISDPQWDNLALPINLLFIFNNGLTGKPTAAYPSPAGATESLLTLENWQAIVSENRQLKNLSSDVEALLINRVGETREYFVAPMDICFELVGLIRKHWRGFSGGELVWTELENFFARLREQASPPSPMHEREVVYA